MWVFLCVSSSEAPVAWMYVETSGWRRKQLWLHLQLDVLSVEPALATHRGSAGRKCLWALPEPQLHMESEPWEPGVCRGHSLCTCEHFTSLVLKLNMVWTGGCWLKRSNFQYFELGIGTEAVEFIWFFAQTGLGLYLRVVAVFRHWNAEAFVSGSSFISVRFT